MEPLEVGQDGEVERSGVEAVPVRAKPSLVCVSLERRAVKVRLLLASMGHYLPSPGRFQITVPPEWVTPCPSLLLVDGKYVRWVLR